MNFRQLPTNCFITTADNNSNRTRCQSSAISVIAHPVAPSRRKNILMIWVAEIEGHTEDWFPVQLVDSGMT